MRVPADVPRPARPGADFVERLLHRLHHRFVLAHAEIVVRAPHGHGLRAVPPEAMGVREAALVAQDVDEHAIAAFIMKALDRGLEDAVVIHVRPRSLAPLASSSAIFHRGNEAAGYQNMRTSPMPKRASAARDGVRCAKVKSIRPSVRWRGRAASRQIGNAPGDPRAAIDIGAKRKFREFICKGK